MITFEEDKKYIIIASEKMKRYGDNKVIIAEKTTDADGNMAYKYDGNIIDPHISIAVELDGWLSISGEFICENFIADCNIEFRDNGYLKVSEDVNIGSHSLNSSLVECRNFIGMYLYGGDAYCKADIRVKDIGMYNIFCRNLTARNVYIYNSLNCNELKATDVSTTSANSQNTVIHASKIFVDHDIYSNTNTKIYCDSLCSDELHVETVVADYVSINRIIRAISITCKHLCIPAGVKLPKSCTFTGNKVPPCKLK